MRHSLQRIGDSRDNGSPFLAWGGAPCLNKADNGTWEKEWNPTSACQHNDPTGGKTLHTLSTGHTQRRNHLCDVVLLCLFTETTLPHSSECHSRPTASSHFKAESSALNLRANEKTPSCSTTEVLAFVPGPEHTLTNLWRLVKCYPRRPYISKEVLKPHQRSLKGHVGCNRSPLISPHTPSPTPRNHTLRIDSGDDIQPGLIAGHGSEYKQTSAWTV